MEDHWESEFKSSTGNWYYKEVNRLRDMRVVTKDDVLDMHVFLRDMEPLDFAKQFAEDLKADISRPYTLPSRRGR